MPETLLSGPTQTNDPLHEPKEKEEHMDLMKFIERMREFREREGYYPAFGETRRREQRDPENLEAEADQPTRPRLVPRSRRRPWK